MHQSMTPLPEIINEGYVGVNSSNQYPPAVYPFKFDISDLIDRSKQIDKILISTDLMRQTKRIQCTVGGAVLVDVPIERYITFQDSCEQDGWFDLFGVIELSSLAFPHLQYHKLQINAIFADEFLDSHQVFRKEKELQQKFNTYVWDEGEPEQLLSTEDTGSEGRYDHCRVEELPDEEVEVTICTTRLPANMVRVEQSIPPGPRSLNAETRTDLFSWIHESEYENWQEYNQRIEKVGDICRYADGYLKCPNVFRTSNGMGGLCYTWNT